MKIRFTIEFYKKTNGRCPFIKYLKGQSIKTQDKITIYLHNLAIQQIFRQEPYSSQLSGKIRELKIETENKAHRIIYFMMIGKKIIILNAFSKKTKKTPRNEIVKAENYMKDYQSRSNRKN